MGRSRTRRSLARCGHGRYRDACPDEHDCFHPASTTPCYGDSPADAHCQPYSVAYEHLDAYLSPNRYVYGDAHAYAHAIPGANSHTQASAADANTRPAPARRPYARWPVRAIQSDSVQDRPSRHGSGLFDEP